MAQSATLLAPHRAVSVCYAERDVTVSLMLMKRWWNDRKPIGPIGHVLRRGWPNSHSLLKGLGYCSFTQWQQPARGMIRNECKRRKDSTKRLCLFYQAITRAVWRKTFTYGSVGCSRVKLPLANSTASRVGVVSYDTCADHFLLLSSKPFLPTPAFMKLQKRYQQPVRQTKIGNKIKNIPLDIIINY